MAYIETGPHLHFQVRAGSLLSNPGTGNYRQDPLHKWLARDAVSTFRHSGQRDAPECHRHVGLCRMTKCPCRPGERAANLRMLTRWVGIRTGCRSGPVRTRMEIQHAQTVRGHGGHGGRRGWPVVLKPAGSSGRRQGVLQHRLLQLRQLRGCRHQRPEQRDAAHGVVQR